jgi:CMP-N,N'-diacetyllegionaminic acid synthase
LAADVVNHFLSTTPSEVIDKDPYIVYLQPTSPLRTGQHINDAIELMISNGSNALMSITELSKSPYKSFIINSDGVIESLFDEKLSNLGRQQLPKSYISNGAIYIFKVSEFLLRKGFPSNGSYPYIMDEIDSIDIDTEDDLILIEKYMRNKNG